MFHVYRHYGSKNALIDITLDVFKNEFLFISGPSGAGKTTLLKLLYLGETVSDGQILIDGMNLSRISHNRIPFLRRNFGIVFQDYKLIKTKTVHENVSIVLEASGVKRSLVKKKVNHVLRTVGMERRHSAFPPSLSGGEQQRVAIARALVTTPSIVIADEPTANVDSETAKKLINLMRHLNKKNKTTFIFSTHDERLLSRVERLIRLEDGKILTKGEKNE